MPLTRIPVHPVFRQDTQANVDAAKLGAWNTTSLRGALEVATVDRAVRGDGPATSIPPAAADFDRQRRQDGDRCDDRVVDPSDEGNIHLHSSTFDAYTGTITITWLGSPRPEVFALLRGAEDETKNLYFSKQYGQSYELAAGIEDTIAEFYCGPNLGGKNEIYCYALPRKAGANYYYLSADSGKTFIKVPTEYTFSRLIVSKQTQGLVMAAREDTGGFVSVDTMYISEDAGTQQAKFYKLATDVVWAEFLSLQAETVDKKNTVLLTRFKNGVQSDLTGLDLVRWEAPFTEATEQVLRHNCYKFEQINEYLFTTAVPKGADHFNEGNLYVSTDEGNTFNEAIFPLQGRANHFKVVDASEGMVMAAVQHSYTRVEGIWRVVVYDAGVVVGNYSTQKALFSPAETADTEAADMFLQSTGANACEKVDAGAKGKIVVIVRGECHFNVKVQNAEDAGAVGVVVINSDDKLFRMGGGNEDAPQQIPSYLITKSDGDALNALFRDSQGLSARFSEDDIKERYLWKESHLYTSDPSGLHFTNSLMNVAYTPQSYDDHMQLQPETVDLHKVSSQPGTYIANIISDNKYVSIITMNKGAHWRRLPAPNNAKCREGLSICGLHLSLETTNNMFGVPLPLSTPQAAGIVVANAWVGEGVGASALFADMYLSRDGGYTWTEVLGPDGEPLDGTHDYRILDHGGLIVAASTGPTNKVYYTVDEGLTQWEQKQIFDDEGERQSDRYLVLSAEPGGRSIQPTVYYVELESYKWMGSLLQFDGILSYDCEASDDELDSAFAPWSPGFADLAPEDKVCLLGQHTVYERRKPCRVCKVGEGYGIVKKDTRACDCGKMDYACAPGFFRANPFDLDAECTYDHVAKFPIKCKVGHSYAKINHYTQVVGDACSATDLSEANFTKAVSTKCTAGGAGFGTFLLALIISSAVLVGLFTGVMFASPRARAWTLGKLGTDGLFGRIGRLVTRCTCYRSGPSYHFRELETEHGDRATFESESDEEMLFGVDDAVPARYE